MSTRSRIGIQNKDGRIESIYCHWDGYLSNNGCLLLNYYQDVEKIKELISLGSISSLDVNIKPMNPEKHSFDSKEENCVVAYCRDRGEELTINRHVNIIDWRRNSHRQEYNYIFIDGKWFYNDGHKKDIKGLTELTEINTREN